MSPPELDVGLHVLANMFRQALNHDMEYATKKLFERLAYRLFAGIAHSHKRFDDRVSAHERREDVDFEDQLVSGVSLILVENFGLQASVAGGLCHRVSIMVDQASQRRPKIAG